MILNGGEGHLCRCGGEVTSYSFPLRDEGVLLAFYSRRMGKQSSHQGPSAEGGLFVLDHCLRFNYCVACHNILPRRAEEGK